MRTFLELLVENGQTFNNRNVDETVLTRGSLKYCSFIYCWYKFHLRCRDEIFNVILPVRVFNDTILMLSKFLLDIRYGYVVDQQPIGRLLFRQYCQDKKPAYHRYNLFLDAIEKYEIEMDENRTELAKDLFEQYLKREGSEVVDVLNDSLIAQCEERLGTGGKELFVEIAQTVKNFLAGEPFSAFQTSFYFYR